MKPEPVPFHLHDMGDEEVAAVTAVLRSRWINTGPETARFEAELAAFTGAERVVALSSGTAAMHLALRAAGIGPGDDVIVPVYTYSATAAAVVHAGATPVPADVGADFCLGADEVLRRMTPRTKAVIAVDLGGLPVDAPALTEALATRACEHPADLGLPARPLLIVDAAHSLGATIDGRSAALAADFTAFSFHAVKNATTGDGGALVLRPGSAAEALERRVRLWALHGQSKSALEKMAPGAWKYDIAVPGFKANMTDIEAALGRVQLRRQAEFASKKAALRAVYASAFAGTRVALQALAVGTRVGAPHLAMTLVDGLDEAARDLVIARAAEAGVALNVHYRILPELTAWKTFGWKSADFPVASGLSRREISLPWHTRMTTDDAARVAEVLLAAVDAA